MGPLLAIVLPARIVQVVAVEVEIALVQDQPAVLEETTSGLPGHQVGAQDAE
ncbi:hypothetical protein D3C78_1699880 [compost metagenome]